MKISVSIGMRRTTLTAFLCLTLVLPAVAGYVRPPRPAPEWQVTEWINGSPGNLADQGGKVVLIEFFQLWCPGCKRFSVPLFNRWHEEYNERDDVLVLSIHTVFEGHDHQTPERLREFVEIWGIEHPVRIDSYAREGDEMPVTMRRFRTGGTPHVVIVDKQGLLRFSHFGSFKEEAVEEFIEQLLEESAP